MVACVRDGSLQDSGSEYAETVEGCMEPIQDMVHEMAEGPMAEAYDAFLEERPETGTMPLYVLTNEIRLNGASVLFYTDCLKRFASDIGRDFFVLPSSIHEVLLLPVMDEMSAWDLRQIVGR